MSKFYEEFLVRVIQDSNFSQNRFFTEKSVTDGQPLNQHSKDNVPSNSRK